MERYIGLIKGLVVLMSNIDMNIAHRMITVEHLNHLPRPGLLKDPSRLDLSEGAAYPFLSSHLKKEAWLTSWMIALLKIRFQQFERQWPIRADEVEVYAKCHPRWRLSYGSVASQGRWVHNRRDDSYILWDYKGTMRYGRVELFCQAYDWDYIAFVRPYDRVLHDEYGRLKAIGPLGALEIILVKEILGIVGRITKAATTNSPAVTFLVTTSAPEI
jgi:hypothetical protein